MSTDLLPFHGGRPHAPCASLLAAALFLSILAVGCAGPGATVLETRPVEAPAPRSSFGAVGSFVETTPVRADTAVLTVSVPEDAAAWFMPSTLHLARWVPSEQRYVPVSHATYDPETSTLSARVTQGGTFGVFGVSRLPQVADLQRRLCLERSGGVASDVTGLAPKVCQQILCRPFDARAWSDAASAQSGLPIGPGDVEGHFGSICDECLGRGEHGPVAGPECVGPGGTDRDSTDWVDLGDPYDPPVLEKLPTTIRWGGRAVAIAVDPSDDDAMIVASETGGLFKSTDGAAHWHHVSDSTTFDFTDVQYVPTNPGVVLASADRDTKTSSGGGIYRSHNGGGSWSQVAVTPPTPACADDFAANALDYEAEQGRLFAGTQCGVAFSDDLGLTWQFLPPAGSYTQQRVWNVAAPQADDLKILVENSVTARVLVTTDGGQSWSTSQTGLPRRVNSSEKLNQIAVSPFDPTHIYWATSFSGKKGLWLSTDDGASWDSVYVRDKNNRPPFVRIARALSGADDAYDIYFSDGATEALWRATATHGDPPTLSAWERLDVDHADVSDVAFAADGRTPLLVASDGGLHASDDQGQTWTATGADGHGYDALQITEVTGQRHESGSGSDLYFGTQDNNIWGSGNSGIDWPGRRRAEGFYLNVPREPLPPDETRVTGVSCGPCTDFMARPVLTSQQRFPFRPEHADESWGYLAATPGPIRNADGDIIGEAGSVAVTQGSAAAWQSVSLSRPYASPVIVAQIMTYAGPDPAHVRLRNVAASAFDVKVEEWDYLDGGHAPETVGYVVLEAGRHVLPGGGLVEVGTTGADHTWKRVSFSRLFPAPPVVISCSQTAAGPDPIVTRQRNVGLGGVDLRLQEEERGGGFHTTETVGYVAVRGASPASTAALEGRLGDALIDEHWSTQPLAGQYAAAPVVVAAMQSANGVKASALRIDHRSATSFDAHVEDELSLAGSPALVQPSIYLQRTRTGGMTTYHLSTDDGTAWTDRFAFAEGARGRPKFAGPPDAPTVFTAVRKPGQTVGGSQRIGIKRTTGVLGAGSPFVSDVTGFGSLGVFPTMFAWYEPYAVDPDDPNTLIIPDIVDHRVERTSDGGQTWDVDAQLTDLVTGGGRFQFDWRDRDRAFVQVDVIEYDPTCDGHIMVGTRQAGIFQSFDDGATWGQVPESPLIPRVSSFYFAGGGETIASSYGRGLWRIRYDCLERIELPRPDPELRKPILYWEGVQVTLTDFDPSSCLRCRWILVEEGRVLGVSIEEGRLQTLFVSGEGVRAYSAEGERLDVPADVQQTDRGPAFEDEGLARLLAAGGSVRGVVLEEGVLRGLLVTEKGAPVGPDVLPREKPRPPHIDLHLPTRGVSLDEAATLVVTGTGFEADRPLELMLDGAQVDYEGPVFDEQGRFHIEIRPTLDVGPHSVQVRQTTAEGEIVDTYSFNVTVSDEPEAQEDAEK